MEIFRKVVISSLFLVFIVSLSTWYGCEKPKKPQVRTVTATKLMSDYIKDPRIADDIYTNSWNSFIVTGMIKEHYKEESDNHVNLYNHAIWLRVDDLKSSLDDNNNLYAEVLCTFQLKPAYLLRDLKVGDFVQINGYVRRQDAEFQGKNFNERKFGGLRKGTYKNTGENYFYVILTDCNLVNK